MADESDKVLVPIDQSELLKSGFRVPRCMYCGSVSRGFIPFDPGVHAGIGIFHTPQNDTPHAAVLLLGCNSCGHIEMFLEYKLRNLMEKGGVEENE